MSVKFTHNHLSRLRERVRVHDLLWAVYKANQRSDICYDRSFNISLGLWTPLTRLGL